LKGPKDFLQLNGFIFKDVLTISKCRFSGAKGLLLIEAKKGEVVLMLN
jgi:hypothetical protein